MIPLQITLDGFMSYREAQTLRFEGATLWLLCGRNGAGKSTVFDAIKYALFATHRGGTQGADALIHHERASLKVAFDFQSGGQTYRVVRTRSRKSRPTVQALRLDTESEGLASLAGAQPIPETDMEEGFRRWLGTTLGLTEATFVASTLLQQGKSDALLEAPPAKRHEMLLEIVDLAPYEALAKKADERRKEAQTQAELLERRLNDLPAVTEEAVAEARQQRDACQARLRALGPRRDALLQLVPRAERWHALNARLQELNDELAAFRALEPDAPEIEQAVARLTELDNVVPLLERAQELGVRAAQAARDEIAARSQLAAANEARTLTHGRLEASRIELQRWETRLSALHTQRDEARTTQLRLAPLLQRLKEWERECAALQRAEADLSDLGPTLDEELNVAEAALSRARQAEQVVPTLRRLAAVVGETQALTAQRGETENAVRRTTEEFAQAQAARLEAETALSAATDALNAQRATEAQCRAACATAQESLCRFEQVEGEARCGYCGQDLSPEHRAWERARLNEAQEHARVALSQTEQGVKSATQAVEAAKSKSQHAMGVERTCEAHLREGETTLRATENNLMRLTREATILYAELPSTWAARLSAGSDFQAVGRVLNDERDSVCLAEVTSAAITEAETVTEVQARVGELQGARGKREVVWRERDAARDRSMVLAQELGEDAQPARAATLREAAETAATVAAEAAHALRASETARSATLSARDTAERELALARDAESQAARSEASAQAQRSEIQRVTATLRDQTPEGWRVRLEDALAERETAEQWRQQRARLQRADVRGALQHWQAARARAAELVRAGEEATREAQDVPLEARRAVGIITAEIAQLGKDAQSYEAEGRSAESELRDLEAHRETRALAEQESAHANRERDLYRTLAEALGRDGLQRRLLQEAEDTIVENANAVLDRLSAGTLRLEVRRETSSPSGHTATQSGLNPNAEIKQKALDLVAYDTGSGESNSPIPTAFLSGSQKFRVAVALAIGIGNYATRGARRVESVIIDEGFGSLDAEGRGAMIEELHGLGDILRRVIVVSHQEDFAAAFPNRYRITQEGGASKAALQSGSE